MESSLVRIDDQFILDIILVGREKAFVPGVIFMRKSSRISNISFFLPVMFADRASASSIRQASGQSSVAGIDADRIEKLAADKFVANDRIVCGLIFTARITLCRRVRTKRSLSIKASKLLRLF